MVITLVWQKKIALKVTTSNNQAKKYTYVMPYYKSCGIVYFHPGAGGGLLGIKTPPVTSRNIIL